MMKVFKCWFHCYSILGLFFCSTDCLTNVTECHNNIDIPHAWPAARHKPFVNGSKGQVWQLYSWLPFFFSCEMTSCSQKHIGIDLSCQKARLLWVVAASVLLLPALITKCHWFYRNIYHNILLCLCSSRDASIFWNIYPFFVLPWPAYYFLFCSYHSNGSP